MNGKVIKVIGIVAAGLGLVATAVGNWASSKKQEDLIQSEVAKAFADFTKDMES